jgi:hypothetical protein
MAAAQQAAVTDWDTIVAFVSDQSKPRQHAFGGFVLEHCPAVGAWDWNAQEPALHTRLLSRAGLTAAVASLIPLGNTRITDNVWNTFKTAAETVVTNELAKNVTAEDTMVAVNKAMEQLVRMQAEHQRQATRTDTLVNAVNVLGKDLDAQMASVQKRADEASARLDAIAAGDRGGAVVGGRGLAPPSSNSMDDRVERAREAAEAAAKKKAEEDLWATTILLQYVPPDDVTKRVAWVEGVPDKILALKQRLHDEAVVKPYYDTAGKLKTVDIKQHAGLYDRLREQLEGLAKTLATRGGIEIVWDVAMHSLMSYAKTKAKLQGDWIGPAAAAADEGDDLVNTSVVFRGAMSRRADDIKVRQKATTNKTPNGGAKDNP